MVLIVAQLILCPVFVFLYSCQRAPKGRYVVFKVHVSISLLTPLDSETGDVDRFSQDNVDDDDDEEYKRGENATLPRTRLNVEQIGITNACLHTAAGIMVD